MTDNNQSITIKPSPFVQALLKIIQQNSITALLIQDYVEKTQLYLEIEQYIEVDFGVDYCWRLSPLYSRDCHIDAYFQHLAEQIDKDQHVQSAADFERLLNKKISSDPKRDCCLLITGFEAGCDDGREGLAGILRSLTETYSLHVMVVGGKYLADKIYADGDLSLLNTARVIRYPDITVEEVKVLYPSLYGDNRPELDNATAKRLLEISGGHPILMHECIKYWDQFGEFQACEKAMMKSAFFTQIFLPFTKDASNRDQMFHWLQQTTLPAFYPYITEPFVNDLYWKNLLKFQIIDGQYVLIWRSETLRNAGYRIVQPFIPKSVVDKPREPIHYLNKVTIKGYFCIEDIMLDNLHDKKEIYIVGENGDGKTLFLQALLLALKGDQDFGFINDYIKPSKTDLKLTATDTADKIYRFPGEKKSFQNVYAYGVHRHRVDSDRKEKRGYLTLFDRNQFLNSPEKWLQQLDYKAKAKETDAMPVAIAKNLIMDLLHPNVDDIIITTDDVTFVERGADVMLDILSEGYRSTIIWVCDLIQRLSTNQPYVTSLSDFKGIVLVDEVDLHLHPNWEFHMVRRLRDKLPNIQFIFTTHSPVVIRGSSEGAVFYKLYKEDGKTKLSKPLSSVKNMMANTVVTSPLFGAETARAYDHDENLDTSDDYLYSVIHREIAKRLKDKKGVEDEDILDEVLAELDAFENDPNR